MASEQDPSETEERDNRCLTRKRERKVHLLLVSITLTCLVLAAVTYAAPNTQANEKSQATYSESFIYDSDAEFAIDDDTTRDDVCKDYLMKFLNGTTDANDECEGMLNAYDAADCTDYSGIDLHRIDDPTPNKTDDDVLIDDTYEAWECCSSIYKYYSSHCHTPDLASFQLLGIVAVLILCALIESLIHTIGVGWIPDAGICILVGAIVGGSIKLFKPGLTLDSDENLRSFNNNLFLHVLLPPIVFSSSLKINKANFWKHLFSILTLAVVGTALSAILIGGMSYGLLHIGNDTTRLPLLECLAFGSLASSIDPVATLGIFDSLGMSQTHETLYTLVFGESLLNDGVAIVLFESLVKHMVVSNSTASAGDVIAFHTPIPVTEILLQFAWVSTASLLIGIGCGLLCTLYYWALSGKQSAVMEVAMFFGWALVPYYISDLFGLSGIISIMVTGFVMDYYVIGNASVHPFFEEAEWMDYVQLECNQQQDTERTGNTSTRPVFPRPPVLGRIVSRRAREMLQGKGFLSRKSSASVKFMAEVIAYVLETAIFAYLGLFLFSDKQQKDVRINTVAVASCLVSRGIMIAILCQVINLITWLALPTRLQGCLRGFLLLRQRRQRQESEHDGEESSSSLLIDEDETTIESNESQPQGKTYLTRDVQWILFLSGVRGAVSFALVENLPVFNALTKHGTVYKTELKAMTSSSILFTVFAFGASTYFAVQRRTDRDLGVQDERLTRRLLSQPLASFDIDDEDQDNANSARHEYLQRDAE